MGGAKESQPHRDPGTNLNPLQWSNPEMLSQGAYSQQKQGFYAAYEQQRLGVYTSSEQQGFSVVSASSRNLAQTLPAYTTVQQLMQQMPQTQHAASRLNTKNVPSDVKVRVSWEEVDDEEEGGRRGGTKRRMSPTYSDREEVEEEDEEEELEITVKVCADFGITRMFSRFFCVFVTVLYSSWYAL
jgi:hypothetical protein